MVQHEDLPLHLPIWRSAPPVSPPGTC